MLFIFIIDDERHVEYLLFKCYLFEHLLKTIALSICSWLVLFELLVKIIVKSLFFLFSVIYLNVCLFEYLVKIYALTVCTSLVLFI